MQTLFSRGPSATFRMAVLVVASIVLMTADHRWQSLELVRSTLSSAIYPLQYTIDLPIRLYYWSEEVFSSRQVLLEKNREFEARHLENRVQLQKLDIIEKENERLRELLSATSKTTERLLISEIINVDVDPYRRLILLNKGSSSDVYQGQAIMDAHGIMGQIIHVSPLSSTAMLITDASHALPVQIDRTGLRANAFGTGKMDQLNLRHLPHNIDIQVGDTLITSGLGGVFPPNYPVARITSVDRPAGEPFATVTAIPLAQLDTSREVLLLWRNDATEKTENTQVLDEKNPADKISNNADTITDVIIDTITGTDNKVVQKKESTQQEGSSDE
jgi:rod shape-determining protein MreC